MPSSPATWRTSSRRSSTSTRSSAWAKGRKLPSPPVRGRGVGGEGEDYPRHIVPPHPGPPPPRGERGRDGEGRQEVMRNEPNPGLKSAAPPAGDGARGRLLDWTASDPA